MPNLIKYSTSAQTLALKKANYWIGTGDVTKGPTSSTDYWNGITPPTSGYTIYQDKGGNGPSIYVPTTDADLIFLTNQIANSNIPVFTSTTQCFSYFFGQVDKMVVNIDYPSITTSGLTLNLDPGFLPSYPRSGTTINDVSPGGNNGTLMNGVGYSTSGGGALQFSAASNQYLITNYVVPGTTFTLSVWFNISTVSGFNTVLIINLPNYQLLTVKQGSPNTFEFWSSDIGAGLNLGSPNISTNTWYNVTYVREGNNITNGYKAYWNGLFTGAQNTVSWAAGSNTLWLVNRSDTSQPFDGLIANAMVYTRALSASEILQNYNAMVVSRFLWSPSVLSPALWLDASDITTITQSGGTVSQWNDKSGNSRNATQATPSLQPAYQATGLNGLPTINWGTVAPASVGKVLYTPSFNIGVSNIAATFVVARANSGVSAYARILVNNNLTPPGYTFWYLGSGLAANTLLSIGGTTTIGTDITFSGITSPFIMASYANTGGLSANNLQTRLNGGSTIVTRTDATGTVGGTNQLAIGAVEQGYTTGQYSWQGVISEIVHFNSALTASQIQLMEGYLAWKWGLQTSLPTNHPYYTSPPVIGS